MEGEGSYLPRKSSRNRMDLATKKESSFRERNLKRRNSEGEQNEGNGHETSQRHLSKTDYQGILVKMTDLVKPYVTFI